MIDRVYEIISASSAAVKYGVYVDEGVEVLTGITEARKKITDFLGDENIPLITVNVCVYASSYINGLNEAIKTQNALKSAGYGIYDEIESDYDRQIGRYLIKFAICEN